MPRTRTELRPDEKRAEILDLAERELAAGGYAGLSVVGIARELGLAQNSIHWYFPTKDDLFVALLRRRVERVLAGKPKQSIDWQDHVIWFVDRLAAHRQLIAAMRERAAHSPSVQQFETEFDQGLEALTTGFLERRVHADELSHAVTLLLAAIDGLLLRGTARGERASALRLLLSRFSTRG